MLSLASRGNVTTETLGAFDARGMEKLLSKSD